LCPDWGVDTRGESTGRRERKEKVSYFLQGRKEERGRSPVAGNRLDRHRLRKKKKKVVNANPFTTDKKEKKGGEREKKTTLLE